MTHPPAAQDEPLSIAYLLTQSLESPSGLGRYWPLARSVAKQGHRVEIFALHPDFQPGMTQPFDRDGVRIQYVAPMHVMKRGSAKTYYSPLGLAQVGLAAAWQLTQAAIRTQARILHVGKPHPMNGLAGLAGRALGGRRLFVDCDDYETGSNRFTASWQRRGVAFFETRLPRAARAVTTNSTFMRDNLIAWGVAAEKIVYIPNGVDLDRFAENPTDAITARRADLGLDGKKVVVYLGSLSLANHAVDLLLEAFVEVISQEPQAALLIVGGGEDYDRLCRLAEALGIADFVRFTGRVPPEDAGVYYRLGNVSVDPVRDDAAARGRSPLKLFESWACGVPFVTADIGDRRTLIGEPPAGILTQPGDRSSLAQGVLAALSDRERARRLSELGLSRSRQFAWDVLSQTVVEMYRREA